MVEGNLSRTFSAWFAGNFPSPGALPQAEIESAPLALKQDGRDFRPAREVVRSLFVLEREANAKLHFPARIEILAGLDSRLRSYPGVGISAGRAGAAESHRLGRAERAVAFDLAPVVIKHVGEV